jgi:hypothetical protein
MYRNGGHPRRPEKIVRFTAKEQASYRRLAVGTHDQNVDFTVIEHPHNLLLRVTGQNKRSPPKNPQAPKFLWPNEAVSLIH